MAFWKKSDDPWDRKPAQVTYSAPETEEKTTLLDELREWRDERRAAAQAEEDAPPQICPWCGKEMEKGYLTGRQTEWSEQKPGILSGNIFHNEVISILTEGALTAYKTCWYCRNCEKMVMDVTRPEPGPWTAPEEPEETADDL